MPQRKRWIAFALVVGAALAYFRYRRDLGRLLENVHRFSAPSASLYDAVSAPWLDGFFSKVAEDLAWLPLGRQVLEIGSGPGRLAAKIAKVAPGTQVTGIDISPEMVELANSLARSSGVADRVEFRVGDAAALPFPDASFDVVVSTLSLHHWQDQTKGLAEIYRVLRPGGVARIYDVVDWIRRFERGGPSITELVGDSPLGKRGAWTYTLAIKIGPVPLVYRIELRREYLNAAGEGES